MDSTAVRTLGRTALGVVEEKNTERKETLTASHTV